MLTVKDIDGIGDIDSVNVDMASIGGGKVELSPDRTVSDDRRCVPYSAIAKIPLAAPYGSTILPVKAVDVAGASDADAVELFIVTSYVEIFRTWAEPETVVSMEKVLLSAEVGIVAPKDGDTPETGEMPENKVERVTVDITEFLGVDCEPDADCIVIVDMKDEDGDGVYEYDVESATGPYGTHLLPVVAYDTLGHVDKDVLKVAIRPETLEKGDLNGDGVVDLKDSLLAFNIAAGLVPLGLGLRGGRRGRRPEPGDRGGPVFPALRGEQRHGGLNSPRLLFSVFHKEAWFENVGCGLQSRNLEIVLILFTPAPFELRRHPTHHSRAASGSCVRRSAENGGLDAAVLVITSANRHRHSGRSLL